MANLSRLFSVKIGRQAVAAKYGVFGVGIILAPVSGFYGVTYGTYETHSAEEFDYTYAVYTNPDDPALDGMSGDNLKAVQAYFSQKPAPDTLVVGDISSVYSKTMIKLNGVPVSGAPTTKKATIGYIATTGEYRYASYNGTIWAGSTGAAADIVVDTNNADQFNVTGRVVYLEGADVLHELSTAQESQVVPAIASIKNQYNKFFMCMTTSRNLTIQKAIADWVESQIDKMGVFIDDYTSSTWATDSITKYLHDKNLSGSFAISTKKPKNFLDAAIAGRCLVMQPGSETWALKTLNGVMSDDFTETDYQKIIALNGNTFEDYGSGVTVTYPGTCGDGESIEVVRFAYWQADRMQKDLATLFVNRNKIGHDMPGYEVVCNQMESSLKAGQSAGGIIENFTDENGDLIRGFEVFRPTMAEVSAVQRIKGDLTVKFQFYLRHAIKHVDAIGTGMTYGI